MTKAKASKVAPNRHCPLCDNPVESLHHIKPKSQGGTDDPRNLVWLCKRCHNEYEDILFTPSLVEQVRRELKGRHAVVDERYLWLYKDDEIVFIGVKVGKDPVIPFNVHLPRDWRLDEAQVGLPLMVDCAPAPFTNSEAPQRRGRGRPKALIPADMAVVLDESISWSEKAKRLGIGKTTAFYRYHGRERVTTE